MTTTAERPQVDVPMIGSERPQREQLKAAFARLRKLGYRANLSVSAREVAEVDWQKAPKFVFAQSTEIRESFTFERRNGWKDIQDNLQEVCGLNWGGEGFDMAEVLGVLRDEGLTVLEPITEFDTIYVLPRFVERGQLVHLLHDLYEREENGRLVGYPDAQKLRLSSRISDKKWQRQGTVIDVRQRTERGTYPDHEIVCTVMFDEHPEPIDLSLRDLRDNCGLHVTTAKDIENAKAALRRQDLLAQIESTEDPMVVLRAILETDRVIRVDSIYGDESMRKLAYAAIKRAKELAK